MTKKAASENVLAVWVERDLTAAVRSGEVGTAFEMEDPLAQATEILHSGRGLILTGEPGVGKTALIGEIVRRLEDGKGPAALLGKTVLQFSILGRIASLKDANQIRPEFQKLIELLSERKDLVPFFRDVHVADIYGMSNLLQQLGVRRPGEVLGEGDSTAVASMFEDWPELEKHFVPLFVEEPGMEQTLRILAGWSAETSARSGKRFTAEALEEAVHLTHRFLARSHQPRKAIDLLGQVASLTPAGGTVTGGAVIDRFSVTHRVPRNLVDPDLPLDLSEIEQRFVEKVLGQEEAVEAVVRMIGRIKSGLTDLRRPFGVFLFAGPTGVGKTHVAQLLAEYLFGSKDRMVRLNMADHQGDTAAEVLFGDPNDSRPHQKRGVLTLRVSGQPFAVLLLDEFEKAHAKVHDRFLQLFDEGRFINGAGETVSCRSMIVIATTNAGADVFQAKPLGFWPDSSMEALAREAERRLAGVFRVEFLNRFDQVVVFRPLGRDHVRTIARRQLSELSMRSGLKRKNLRLEVDESVIDWLAVNGYDPHFGARFLKRVLEREVTGAVADLVVRSTPAPGSVIELGVRKNRVHASALSPATLQEKPERAVVPYGSTRLAISIGDLEDLRSRTAELLERAGPHLAALEDRRAEARHLLEEMNRAGFWDGGSRTQEALDRYRELDVAIQGGGRLASALENLSRFLESASRPGALSAGVRLYEQAADALRHWDERVAGEGPGSVWLLLESQDGGSGDRFLEDLVKMEEAWCARCGLTSSVLAYEEADGRPVRVVLDVEGSGAARLLSMEVGVHRLYRREGHDSRVRIELFEQETASRPSSPRVEARKARKGLLGVEVRAFGRIDVPETGLTAEFHGSHAETLEWFLSAFRKSRSVVSPESPRVVRLYGHSGTGGRDPRTEAVVPRLKDVLRGELDPFLEGWRRLSGGGLKSEGRDER